MLNRGEAIMEKLTTQLTTKEILDKEFKTSMRGYNQEEVDAFLDVIIQDYEQLAKQITTLKEENERLRDDDDRTQPQRPRMQSTNHQVNYDILKRVSNLEKAVFGKKYTE